MKRYFWRGEISLLYMNLTYSKDKLLWRLNALNNIVTKIWKNWNRFMVSEYSRMKILSMLYFHLVWYTKRKLVRLHDFLRQQIFHVTKKPSPLFKKIKFWQAYNRAVTHNVSVLRISRSQMFCEVRVLKNFAKFTEKHLCWSLCFN